jgi:hypothetical protein
VSTPAQVAERRAAGRPAAEQPVACSYLRERQRSSAKPFQPSALSVRGVKAFAVPASWTMEATACVLEWNMRPNRFGLVFLSTPT